MPLLIWNSLAKEMLGKHIGQSEFEQAVVELHEADREVLPENHVLGRATAAGDSARRGCEGP